MAKKKYTIKTDDGQNHNVELTEKDLEKFDNTENTDFVALDDVRVQKYRISYLVPNNDK